MQVYKYLYKTSCVNIDHRQHTLYEGFNCGITFDSRVVVKSNVASFKVAIVAFRGVMGIPNAWTTDMDKNPVVMSHLITSSTFKQHPCKLRFVSHGAIEQERAFGITFDKKYII